MKFRRILSVGLISSAALSACGDDEAPPSTIARIQVEPAGFILSPGGARVLQAKAFDATGAEVQAEFSYRSTNEAALGISGATATALAPLGSAQIIVEAEGVRAPPVLVVIARPAAGALAVEDEQIVEGPTRVGTSTVGPRRMQATLNVSPAPEVGQIVVGMGAKPLAGRVISAEATANGQQVVLELVPLAEFFEDLTINERIDLDDVPLVIDEAAKEIFDVTEERTPAGRRVHFAKKPIAALKQGLGPEVPAPPGFAGFECKATAMLTGLSGSGVDFDLLLDLDGQYIEYEDESLKKLALAGTTSLKVTCELTLSLGLQGDIACVKELISYTPPVFGALSYFFGIAGKLEAGVAAKGLFEIGEIGFKQSVEYKETFTIGIHCSPDGLCEGINEFESETKFSESPFVLAGPLTGLQAELEAGPLIRQKITAKDGLDFFNFDLVEASERAVVSLKVSPATVQAANPTLAGEYKLLARAQIKAGTDVGELLGYLGVNLTLFDFKFDLELAESPKGTLVAPEMLAAGTPAQLTVTLDPESSTFLGLSNVSAVHIYREAGLFGPFQNKPVSSPIPSEVSFDWMPTPAEAGDHTFAAFVETTLLPGLLFEVKTDSRKVVTVTADERPPALAYRVVKEDIYQDYFCAGAAPGYEEVRLLHATTLTPLPNQPVEFLPMAFGGPAGEFALSLESELTDANGIVRIRASSTSTTSIRSTASIRFPGVEIAPEFSATNNPHNFLVQVTGLQPPQDRSGNHYPPSELLSGTGLGVVHRFAGQVIFDIKASIDGVELPQSEVTTTFVSDSFANFVPDPYTSPYQFVEGGYWRRTRTDPAPFSMDIGSFRVRTTAANRTFAEIDPTGVWQTLTLRTESADPCGVSVTTDVYHRDPQ